MSNRITLSLSEAEMANAFTLIDECRQRFGG